ncbi:MAG: SRPBCC family protein [Deltaproteobacteria bacterium]|nr:MAG: SRPBCC family protein [Deltaproteobacteria bacterium]
MKVYRLERQQFIRAPLETVFAFFRDAANLQAITPKWLGFGFVSKPPAELRVGTRIDYRLRLAGVPLRWRTVITGWDPPRSFCDTQERGPYALWEHTHLFEVQGGGVLMTDIVRYALPLGPLGRATHALAVHSALARIFDHRYEVIRETFDPPGL